MNCVRSNAKDKQTRPTTIENTYHEMSEQMSDYYKVLQDNNVLDRHERDTMRHACNVPTMLTINHLQTFDLTCVDTAYNQSFADLMR